MRWSQALSGADAPPPALHKFSHSLLGGCMTLVTAPADII